MTGIAAAGRMLDRWLMPAPDSLCVRSARGNASNRSARYLPLVHLIWTCWLLCSPWLDPHPSLARMLLTYGSFAVFLVLYVRAWYGPAARLGWNIAAMSVLGLVTLHANPAAWTYVIFTCALLPFLHSVRRAGLLFVALMLVFAADARWVGFSAMEMLSSAIACLGLFGGNLVWRYHGQREAELRLTHEEVRRLAAVAERERIGRDLHDLLGHTLSLIAIKSELAERLFDRDPAQAREEVCQLRHVAREALTEVRAAVSGMRAAGLAAERVSVKLLLDSAGIGFDADFDEVAVPPPVDAELALALRELCTNVERHARARAVQLRLQQRGRIVELIVADDGCGGVDTARAGTGLQSLRERLQALGGSVHIDSPKGKGTRVSLRVPLPVNAVAAQVQAA